MALNKKRPNMCGLFIFDLIKLEGGKETAFMFDRFAST
jgi:hypothetical protein